MHQNSTMQNLHIINYNYFTADELCQYLEERHYTQILSDMESIQKYLTNLSCTENSELIELISVMFQKLYAEIQQLFAKDRILLFPYLRSKSELQICLTPFNLLHQQVNSVLIQLRKVLNNYVQKPAWSNQFKICCNELFALEQSVQHVMYIKENFLWTKIQTIPSHEY